MRNNSKNSGTDFVRILWGKDFCQFCRIKEDLMDLLVPYLKTGLEDNELCILPHKSTGSKRSPYGLPDLDIILEVRDITRSKWGEDESGGALKNYMQQARSWLASTAHGGREVWLIKLKEGMNKLCFRLGEHFSC